MPSSIRVDGPARWVPLAAAVVLAVGAVWWRGWGTYLLGLPAVLLAGMALSDARWRVTVDPRLVVIEPGFGAARQLPTDRIMGVRDTWPATVVLDDDSDVRLDPAYLLSPWSDRHLAEKLADELERYRDR